MHQELPPKAEASSIGREYFTKLPLVLPVIEESSFWGAVEAVYSSSDSMATSMHHWIVRMVLANTLISRSMQYDDYWYRLARRHVSSALPLAEVVLKPDSIQNLQAMLLLAEYSRYDPLRFDNWILVGAASRAMVDLGLHQDPPRRAKISPTALETRRRIFLSLYTSDRRVESNTVLHRSS